MAWNPNIPQPTDALSQSQADILANFQALDSLFDGGVQNFILLPVQTSAPTTSSTEVSLFSQVNSASGLQELYFGRVSSGPTIPMTASSQSTSGWSYLPSGLLIKWGVATISSRNTIVTVTLPGSPAPVFSNVFNVTAQVTFTGTSGSVQGNINIALGIGNITTTAFDVFGRAIAIPGGTPAFTINYLAIGN